MSPKKFCLAALIVCLALTFGTVSARAESVSYVLNMGGSGLAGYTAPYAWVTFSLQGDGSILATINSNVGLGYGMKDSFGFNSTLNNLSFKDANGNAILSSSGNLDGFGSFSYVLSSLGSSSITTYSFSIYKNGGGFSSLAQFTSSLTLTSGGAFFGLHSTVANGTQTGWSAGLNQGSPNPVPEPASLALLGSGLVAVGGFFRRRYKR